MIRKIIILALLVSSFALCGCIEPKVEVEEECPKYLQWNIYHTCSFGVVELCKQAKILADGGLLDKESFGYRNEYRFWKNYKSECKRYWSGD